jgi:hypothetical protein
MLRWYAEHLDTVETMAASIACLRRMRSPAGAGKHNYVSEFRNQSRNVPPVYEVLRRHNAACCVYEPGGSISERD